MARERKQTQAYKPDNFNKKTNPKPKTTQKSTKNPPPPPDNTNNEPMAAIDVIEPRLPVPQDNNIKISNNYSKKYRSPKDYKKLKSVNDEITSEYTDALKTVKFKRYDDERLNFTIWQKAERLEMSINSDINGKNTITSKVYALDYTPKQYDELKYIVKPSLADVRNNRFVGEKKDDKKLLSGLNVILKEAKDLNLDPIDLTTILRNHREIMFIMLRYIENKNASPFTYWDYIRALARLAKISLGEDDELYKKLSKISDDYDKAVLKNIETDNKLNLDEKRVFVPYSVLLDMIGEMKKQFEDALAKYGADKEATYKLHMNTLILMSYLYTPPVRSELSNMVLTNTLEGLDKKTNYVYVSDNENQVAMYIFNTIHKKHPPIRYYVGYPNGDEQNDPLAKLLTDFIRLSMKLYPRKYYITQYRDKNQPAGANQSKYLSKMFQKQNLNVNGFRSSYVSWLYSNNVSTKILEQVALKMRSSLRSQQYSYKKDNSEQIKVKREPIDDSIPITINDVNEPMPQAANIEAPPPREVKFYKDVVEANRQHQRKHVEKIGKDTYAQKQKEYRANNKDILGLRRVLKKYNNTVYKPTEKFINKWKLYKKNGKWMSELEN